MGHEDEDLHTRVGSRPSGHPGTCAPARRIISDRARWGISGGARAGPAGGHLDHAGRRSPGGATARPSVCRRPGKDTGPPAACTRRHVGQLVDTSVFIALERQQLDLETLVAMLPEEPISLAAITA